MGRNIDPVTEYRSQGGFSSYDRFDVKPFLVLLVCPPQSVGVKTVVSTPQSKGPERTDLRDLSLL